jgi:hypothetical protein
MSDMEVATGGTLALGALHYNDHCPAIDKDIPGPVYCIKPLYRENVGTSSGLATKKLNEEQQFSEKLLLEAEIARYGG